MAHLSLVRVDRDSYAARVSSKVLQSSQCHRFDHQVINQIMKCCIKNTCDDACLAFAPIYKAITGYIFVISRSIWSTDSSRLLLRSASVPSTNTDTRSGTSKKKRTSTACQVKSILPSRNSIIFCWSPSTNFIIDRNMVYKWNTAHSLLSQEYKLDIRQVCSSYDVGLRLQGEIIFLAQTQSRRHNSFIISWQIASLPWHVASQ